MGRVTIKPGHVRPLFAGHPWVFQQAVSRVEGGAQPGDEVEVRDPEGRILGSGLYSPKSAIAVRMFTHGPEPVDGGLIRRRIESALARRTRIGLPCLEAGRETTGYRLVHGEGDRIPGLVVDVFGDVVAVQLNTIGIKRREGIIFDALTELLHPRAIVDRTPESMKRLEGFDPASGVVRGDASITELVFKERGFEYRIPLSIGQKTGFYFDQRELRARIETLARGRTVLDTFSFVGPFSLAAARGGATQVVCVDESAPAITVASEIALANGLSGKISFQKQEAKRALQEASAAGGYELVICDPPKLAPSKANREQALIGYQRLARMACRATKVGGLLVFCSCSGAVSLEDLVRAVALGAAEARMNATVLERHFQAPDHPVPAAFPEGLYLKALVVELTSETSDSPDAK